MCELAVVKIGTKGAMIKQGDEVVHVGIMAAAKRVDTTERGISTLRGSWRDFATG